MLKKQYLAHTKLQGGPAGWYCPCCNPYGCHPRNMKKKARRLARRVDRLEVKKSLQSAD